jgi:hypothetical protein
MRRTRPVLSILRMRLWGRRGEGGSLTFSNFSIASREPRFLTTCSLPLDGFLIYYNNRFQSIFIDVKLVNQWRRTGGKELQFLE